MQTVILGTSGNDFIESNAASTGNGALVLTVSGTIAQNERPLFDVLVNGTVVRSGISVTMDHATGTQQVYVPMPAGTINSVTIDYTNDPQTDYTTQDRNLFVSSAVLNGVNLPVTDALYTRDGFTGPFNAEDGHVITGREDMNWGGEMTWSGAAVQNAVASGANGLLIDAGAGIDTVHFANARASYSLTHSATGFSITPTGGGTTTSFGSVERLAFGDGSHVAIDTDGNAGLAAKMIAALLGTSFLTNQDVVGTALHYLDTGTDATTLMQVAANTSGFQALAGGSSNADFVRYVYHNLAGFDPSASDLNTITGWLDSGLYTKGSLAMLAANLDINETHVVAAGVTAHGLDYTLI